MLHSADNLIAIFFMKASLILLLWRVVLNHSSVHNCHAFVKHGSSSLIKFNKTLHIQSLIIKLVFSQYINYRLVSNNIHTLNQQRPFPKHNLWKHTCRRKMYDCRQRFQNYFRHMVSALKAKCVMQQPVFKSSFRTKMMGGQFKNCKHMASSGLFIIPISTKLCLSLTEV